MEKAIATQMHCHLLNKEIVSDCLLSRTALLRVYNDIGTAIEKGNCAIHYPYTSTYSSTYYNSNWKHKHTTYFNTPRLINTSLTTATTQKDSHRPPHSHYNIYKNKHAPYTYIYCLWASSHKITIITLFTIITIIITICTICTIITLFTFIYYYYYFITIITVTITIITLFTIIYYFYYYNFYYNYYYYYSYYIETRQISNITAFRITIGLFVMKSSGLFY